jgi:hypothetical protein
MRNFPLLLLLDQFLDFASYVERNEYEPKIIDDSQKGPPGIKTFNLAYLNATDRTIYKVLNLSIDYKTNDSI